MSEKDFLDDLLTKIDEEEKGSQRPKKEEKKQDMDELDQFLEEPAPAPRAAEKPAEAARPRPQAKPPARPAPAVPATARPAAQSAAQQKPSAAPKPAKAVAIPQPDDADITTEPAESGEPSNASPKGLAPAAYVPTMLPLLASNFVTVVLP